MATNPGCPSGPDLLQREIDPGLPAATIRLGAYSYDAQLDKCVGTVEFTRMTTPQVHGVCITIAAASNNPGYDEDAEPSPPLKHLIASFGDGC